MIVMMMISYGRRSWLISTSFFFIDVLTVYKGYLIKIDNLLEIHNNRKYKVFPDVGKN